MPQNRWRVGTRRESAKVVDCKLSKGPMDVISLGAVMRPPRESEHSVANLCMLLNPNLFGGVLQFWVQVSEDATDGGRASKQVPLQEVFALLKRDGICQFPLD